MYTGELWGLAHTATRSNADWERCPKIGIIGAARRVSVFKARHDPHQSSQPRGWAAHNTGRGCRQPPTTKWAVADGLTPPDAPLAGGTADHRRGSNSPEATTQGLCATRHLTRNCYSGHMRPGAPIPLNDSCI